MARVLRRLTNSKNSDDFFSNSNFASRSSSQFEKVQQDFEKEMVGKTDLRIRRNLKISSLTRTSLREVLCKKKLDEFKDWVAF